MNKQVKHLQLLQVEVSALQETNKQTCVHGGVGSHRQRGGLGKASLKR